MKQDLSIRITSNDTNHTISTFTHAHKERPVLDAGHYIHLCTNQTHLSVVMTTNIVQLRSRHLRNAK